MKRKLLKRRKKKAVQRRKHYLDEALLQLANSAVFVVKRTDNGGIDSKGWGQTRLLIMAGEATLSDAIWTMQRTLGDGAKFEIEQIVSGIFTVDPECLHDYCNLDGRVFNEKMEVVRKGGRR